MTTFAQQKMIQSATRDWLASSKWANPYAVTLNLKQVTTVVTDRGFASQCLDEQSASQNLRHLLNRLNKHFHGNAARRFGRKLQVVPVVEGGTTHRLHYHLLIDLPPKVDLEEAYPLFVDQWLRTQWGYGHTHVQQCYDDGWLDYITKTYSKPDFFDSIDLQNLNMPSLTAQ
ncbi:hypothetical protein [Novosphingobium sp. PASSN1]|uniref:rolling circle replication-associated protein n=1 Tax=Novosphingobium sp. PASSN1 TaxID=2015561 RepID=UPI000BC85EBB|nr:hypothetical protein [Novosphingobium sp. PASSN1]OYU36362.1 MAG: hypothetical protein CFE35_03390 [Novosphingobium sp. PASSN1]